MTIRRVTLSEPTPKQPNRLAEREEEQQRARTEREFDDRLRKVENREVNDVKVGVPENPEAGQVAWVNGDLYARNPANTAWDAVGSIKHYTASTYAGLPSPTQDFAFGTVTGTGADAGLYSYYNGTWTPVNSYGP